MTDSGSPLPPNTSRHADTTPCRRGMPAPTILSVPPPPAELAHHGAGRRPCHAGQSRTAPSSSPPSFGDITAHIWSQMPASTGQAIQFDIQPGNPPRRSPLPARRTEPQTLPSRPSSQLALPDTDWMALALSLTTSPSEEISLTLSTAAKSGCRRNASMHCCKPPARNLRWLYRALHCNLVRAVRLLPLPSGSVVLTGRPDTITASPATFSCHKPVPQCWQ